MIWDAILNILNWGKDRLPIPKRLEGIKNEIDKLERERNAILISKADIKKAKRVAWIDARLLKLNGMLKNSTGSS